MNDVTRFNTLSEIIVMSKDRVVNIIILGMLWTECLWLPKIHMLKLNPSMLLYQRIWYLLSLSIHKVRNRKKKWKTKHKEWKLQKGATCQTFLNFQVGCVLNTSQMRLWTNGWITFALTSRWKKMKPGVSEPNPGMTTLLQCSYKERWSRWD